MGEAHQRNSIVQSRLAEKESMTRWFGYTNLRQQYIVSPELRSRRITTTSCAWHISE
jgi:hypothetical protein